MLYSPTPDKRGLRLILSRHGRWNRRGVHTAAQRVGGVGVSFPSFCKRFGTVMPSPLSSSLLSAMGRFQLYRRMAKIRPRYASPINGHANKTMAMTLHHQGSSKPKPTCANSIDHMMNYCSAARSPARVSQRTRRFWPIAVSCRGNVRGNNRVKFAFHAPSSEGCRCHDSQHFRISLKRRDGKAHRIRVR